LQGVNHVNPKYEAPTFDPRYKTLYRLGGLASILTAVLIVFAIGAFFIWPYQGNTKLKPSSASCKLTAWARSSRSMFRCW
jgi:hypothetical protein